MISPDLKRLLAYLRNYKINVVFNFFFNLLFIIFSLFSIGTIAPFLSLIFDENRNIDNKAAVAFDMMHIKEYVSYKANYILNIFPDKSSSLIYLCFFIVVVFLMKNIFRYIAIYHMSSIRNGIVRDLQNELYSKILGLPLSFFSKEKKGDLMMRMTSDVKEVEYGVLGVLEIMFKDPLFIVLYFSIDLFKLTRNSTNRERGNKPEGIIKSSLLES